jgi:hypothetical protein
MNPKSIWRQIALLGVVVLVGYFGVFNWVERRRFVKGPWQVSFTQSNSAPVLVINQFTLRITNVMIVFEGSILATNVSETVAFGQGRAVPFDLPFGKCVFLDPLFLPGTAACEVFGHQIQIIPRVLMIDGIERPWVSGGTFVLTNKPASQPQR